MVSVRYSISYYEITLSLGLLMISIVTLSLFNLLVLLSPPRVLLVILELMPLPFSARSTMVWVVMMNVTLSMVFEQWGSEWVARLLGKLSQFQFRRGRRRVRTGKIYGIVEG
jgi:cation-transporting P-type ATPase 13A2